MYTRISINCICSCSSSFAAGASTPYYCIWVDFVDDCLGVGLGFYVFDAFDQDRDFAGSGFACCQDFGFLVWVANDRCDVPGSREELGGHEEGDFAVAAEKEDVLGRHGGGCSCG